MKEIPKKDYTELRENSKFIKTVGVTLEVYQWIEQNRGKKPRATFLDDFIKEAKQPNLFRNKK